MLFVLTDREKNDLVQKLVDKDICIKDRRLCAIRLGLHFYSIGDYSLMLEYFDKAYSMDSDWACYYLGQIYYRGCGVNQDIDKAIEYLEKALAKDFPDGYGLLIEIYKKKLQCGKLDDKKRDELNKKILAVEDKWAMISQITLKGRD